MHIKSTNWFGIWICFSAGLAAAITMNKASPAALNIAADLDLSLFQIGWLVSVVAIGMVVLGFASGHLILRFGALKVLTAGVTVLLLTPWLSLFATTSPLLMVERSLEGVGVILVMVSAPAAIINVSRPEDVGLSMAVWALWMPTGSSLIFLLAPWLLNIDGWRSLWLSSAVAAAVVFPFLLYLLRVDRREIQAVPLSESATVSTSTQSINSGSISVPGAVLLAIIFLCFGAGFFGVLTYLPTYLHTVSGFSTANASLLTALLPAVLIVGNLLAGGLLHRGLQPALVMSISAVLVSITLWVTMILADGLLAIIFLVLFGLFTGVVPTAMFAQAPRFAASPRAVGVVIGIMVTGQGIGLLFAPPLIAYLVGPSQNWIAALPLLVMLPLIVALLAVYLPRFENQWHAAGSAAEQ